MTREPTRQVSLRLPDSLVVRLDALATSMSRAEPGLVLTRADIVRMLLVRGLEAAADAHVEEAS